jgi:hypothetical protein
MLKCHAGGTGRMLPPEDINHIYMNIAEQNIEISTKKLWENNAPIMHK